MGIFIFLMGLVFLAVSVQQIFFGSSNSFAANVSDSSYSGHLDSGSSDQYDSVNTGFMRDVSSNQSIDGSMMVDW